MYYCCSLGCDCPAEWVITPQTATGLYEQTHACSQHVGELLSSVDGSAPAFSFLVQAVKQEAAGHNCWKNDMRRLRDELDAAG